MPSRPAAEAAATAPPREFSLLVKPAGADCNLRCAHCFYLPKAGLYPEIAHPRMGQAVLERLVAGYLATPQRVHTFGWQGGEPTLLGVDFFRQVTALQRRHGRAGTVVANGLQTNATLVDAPLAAHLAEFNFLVGVSLDGPPELHDRYRRDADGAGSHATALRGIALLREHRVELNVLALVTAANVARPRDLYRYLCDQGFRHHQYIPCVEADASGVPLPFAIGPEQWGDFLCALFDEWRGGDARRISVRLFDALLAALIDGACTICHLGRDCRQYFVVEHNGDVYPCDFFVTPGLRLGNVLTASWTELSDHPAYRAFGRRKRERAEACASCPWLRLCEGDCPKHRLGSGTRPLSRLCAGWRQFFAHAMPHLRQLAAGIRRDRAAAARPGARPERNGPCPCGSGRKHKKCCGR